MKHHQSSRKFTARGSAIVAAGMVVGLALTGCAPGASTGAASTSVAQVTTKFTKADISKLGNITLTAWADTTEQPFLDKLVVDYEKEYPNVSLKISYKSFDDHMATVVNAAAGATPPDLIEGDNGYAVDGALVKAKLVRPIDDLAKAYGWNTKPLATAKWDPTGASFGSGTLYGISAIAEVQSIYYNSEKVKALGVQPPTTIPDLAKALAVAKAAGEVPLMLGNSSQWSATDVFANIAASKQKASSIRSWIGGEPGSTFVTDGNKKAATEITSWASEGYFNSDYNALTNMEARAKFALGSGVFFPGGSWNGAGLTDNPNFRASSLVSGGSGGISQPWSISSKSKNVAAAAAFLDMMQTPKVAQNILDSGLLPLNTSGVKAKSALARDTLANLKATAAAGALIGYYSYTTSDMGTVMGAALQDTLAGRTTSDDFVSKVQATWAAGHK